MSTCVSWPARVDASDDWILRRGRLARVDRLLAPPLRRLVRAPGRADGGHSEEDRRKEVDAVASPVDALGHENTFTARAITRPTTASEITDWSAIVNFAQMVMGMTSVGLNAVLVVSPRIR